jgi:hypothetical protein
MCFDYDIGVETLGQRLCMHAWTLYLISGAQ